MKAKRKDAVGATKSLVLKSKIKGIVVPILEGTLGVVVAVLMVCNRWARAVFVCSAAMSWKGSQDQWKGSWDSGAWKGKGYGASSSSWGSGTGQGIGTSSSDSGAWEGKGYGASSASCGPGTGQGSGTSNSWSSGGLTIFSVSTSKVHKAISFISCCVCSFREIPASSCFFVYDLHPWCSRCLCDLRRLAATSTVALPRARTCLPGRRRLLP